MLELGRKEQQMMGGHLIFILVVGLMVFAYTQAIRQLKLNRDFSQRLQEQIAVAREQLARQGGGPAVADLQAQVEELKSVLVASGAPADQAGRLKRLAQERFGIANPDVTAEKAPIEKVSVPLGGRSSLDVRLHPLEMRGTASTRNLAGLVAAVSDPAFKPICPLVAMELRSLPGQGQVEFLFRWLMAVSPDSSTPVDTQLPPPGRPPAWGHRQEPFLSPLSHPNAFRSPTGGAGLQLSGILMEGTAPSCVINRQVLQAGESIDGYQVVLIAPDAVLLEGKGQELLLRLP